MNPFIVLTLFFCGAILLWRSGEELQAMSAKTNHVIRVAQWLIAIGAFLLVLGPVSHYEPLLLERGLSIVVFGQALKSMFERRRRIEMEGKRN